MATGRKDLPVIEWTFGVPTGPSGWTLPDQVRAQLRLAHDLREDLVTIQHEHQRAVDAVWSSYDAVAHVERLLAQAEHAVAETLDQIRAERIRQGTKRITGDLPVRLKHQRAEAKRLRLSRRDQIAAVSKDAKPRHAELFTQLQARQRQLYAPYCQDGDLYSATFNMIVRQHKTAVNRIAAQRRQGLSAVLRHHHFDGTGTLAVQLPRVTGQPPNTPAVVADPAGTCRNRLQLPWIDPAVWATMSRAEQRKAGRFTVRMRCGQLDGDRQWINFPVQAHRMLPADADLTGAELTITRAADQFRARLTVSARIPHPTPVTDGPTVAVHMGWQHTDLGTQVATWQATEPLEIPHEWSDVLRAAPDRMTGTIIVPEHIMARYDRAHRLRAVRDRDRNRLRTRLAAWLTEHGPLPHPTHAGQEVSDAEVRVWSRAQLAELACACTASEHPLAGDKASDIVAVLTARTRTDRSRWQEQEGLRGRALRRRNNVWANIAAILAGQCGQLVLDDTPIADLPGPETVTAPRRALASPGRLRTAITTACARDGVLTVTVSGAGLTRDPDRSATELMLARARAKRRSA
ncbi:hypothetical protein [Nocardia sp. NPDC059239]|uniref:hypothetical protein n=1 Tax=Nocardia sp. NPDC059239 TaxID=3346785 RepID=UPI0036A1BDDE